MLKYPLLISILFATLIPFAPGLSSYFTLTRLFTFMPFFVAGYLLANGDQKIKDIILNPIKTFKIISAIFLATLTAIFIFWSNLKDTYIGPWLYRREGYKKLSVGTEDLKPLLNVDYEESFVLFSAASIGLSILFLVVTFLASVATLVLIPRKESFISRFGSKTLYIYLLHIPIIWSLNHVKIPASFYYTYGLKALLLMAVLSLILTFVLGSKMVTRIFKPLVEPNISFLVKSDKQR